MMEIHTNNILIKQESYGSNLLSYNTVTINTILHVHVYTQVTHPKGDKSPVPTANGSGFLQIEHIHSVT